MTARRRGGEKGGERGERERKRRGQARNPLEPLLKKLAREFVDSADLSDKLARLYQAGPAAPCDFCVTNRASRDARPWPGRPCEARPGACRDLAGTAGLIYV